MRKMGKKVISITGVLGIIIMIISYSPKAYVPYSSGAWTPTLTNGSNSTGASLGAARYSRMGDIVTFAFTFTTTTSSGSTATSVSATLPIASNFTVGNQASGTNCGLTGNVVADFSNDILSVNWVSGTGGSETITVVGQYIIL